MKGLELNLLSKPSKFWSKTRLPTFMQYTVQWENIKQ